MFDLAWSELALIGVVALVVIGPKDLPEAVRGLARGIQKLRRMAGEFQQHADELVKEANLEEVRQQINEIRNFNIRDTIERAVDNDGTIRRTFTEDPLAGSGGMVFDPPASPPAAAGTAEATPAAAMEGTGAATPATTGTAAEAGPPIPPAFIPPGEAHLPPPAPPPAAAAAAFIPPAEAHAAAAPAPLAPAAPAETPPPPSSPPRADERPAPATPAAAVAAPAAEPAAPTQKA